jgi:anionic cell wall polymer biosynthesis LytR-Cps2A-Psr (LCP) family protein
MNRITAINVAALLFIFLAVLIAFGQKRLLNSGEIDEKFSQVWKTSEASRKNYSWKERTVATRNDKLMETLIEELAYGSDGRLIRRVISDQEAPLPSTFIIHQVAEDQKAKIVSFMKDLRVFLEKYALTDDTKRHSFFSKATIREPDVNGQLVVSGTEVFASRDTLIWWINTRTYSLTKASISTTFEGASVGFTAFYDLLSGLNYMTQARIQVPSKNMVVQLQFYDFVRNN